MLFIKHPDSGSWMPYAGGRSCTLHVTADTAEVLPDTGNPWDWPTYVATQCGWTMEASGLLTLGENGDLLDPIQLLTDKEPFLVGFDYAGEHPDGKPSEGFTPTGLHWRYGFALLTDYEEEGDYSDEATYSMSFQGTGPLYTSGGIVGTDNLWLDYEKWYNTNTFIKVT